MRRGESVGLGRKTSERYGVHGGREILPFLFKKRTAESLALFSSLPPNSSRLGSSCHLIRLNSNHPSRSNGDKGRSNSRTIVGSLFAKVCMSSVLVRRELNSSRHCWDYCILE